ILALDAAGNGSAASVPVTVTTPASTDPTAPSTPTGLTGTLGRGYISLTWDPSTNSSGQGILAYNLYRNGRLFLQVSAPATNASDAEVRCSATYSYSVSAVNNAG